MAIAAITKVGSWEYLWESYAVGTPDDVVAAWGEEKGYAGWHLASRVWANGPSGQPIERVYVLKRSRNDGIRTIQPSLTVLPSVVVTVTDTTVCTVTSEMGAKQWEYAQATFALNGYFRAPVGASRIWTQLNRSGLTQADQLSAWGYAGWELIHATPVSHSGGQTTSLLLTLRRSLPNS